MTLFLCQFASCQHLIDLGIIGVASVAFYRHTILLMERKSYRNIIWKQFVSFVSTYYNEMPH